MWSADNLLATRAPMLPIALSMMGGIVIGINTSLPYTATPLWLCLAGLLVLQFFFKSRPLTHTFFIFLCTLLLGMLLAIREQNRQQQACSGQVEWMEAVVASEPTEKAKTMAVELLLCKTGQSTTCYFKKDERSRALKPGDGVQLLTRIENGWHHTLHCYAAADKWQRRPAALQRLSIVDRMRITFLRWRHSLLEQYRLLGASDDAYSVLAAMTLGDKSALSRELRDTYSVTGASHVLALSGLHLGIIYMLLSSLTFYERRRSIVSQTVLILSIWAFALLVGLPVSVVRSACMISIFALFSLGQRPHMSVNLLALAAIIILLLNPLALYDIGFQLSFLSVFSILLALPLMEGKRTKKPEDTKNFWKILIRWVKGSFWISLAAQLGTAPLIAFYFGRFSTYFLLTNLIVIPAAYAILCGALLMIVLPQTGGLVVWTVERLNDVLTGITKLPMASLEGLHPSVVQVLLCYVCVAALLVIASVLSRSGWQRS